MYIPPFWAGVLSTIGVEIAILFAIAIWRTINK